MARAEKVTAVAELTERFQSSSGAVLTEYRGLSVSQLGELRKLLAADATYSVVKNTITKIAANEAGVTPELTKLLTGPSAIAFVQGDVVAAARGLRDFAKANPLLVIKGGVLDGKPLTPDEIVKLADLESREVLLSKLAGAMKASLANAAGTFAALPVQMAQLLGALEAKRAAEEPATTPEAPAAGAPAVEAHAAEAPGADAPAADAQAAGAPATDAAEATTAEATTAEGNATDTTSEAAEAAAADGSES